MKVQYEVGDKVIVKNTSSIYKFDIGEKAEIINVDYSAFANGDEPYQIRGDNERTGWVYDYNIEPATISFLTEMNEIEVTEYKDKMLEVDNKKCLEFLAKNPSEYFSLEEIYKNANISFTSLETLERILIRQSKFPFWKQEELGYEVAYKIKPNKKKYYGDDGSVLFRGKSELYFCAIEKVKEEYDYDDEEGCEDDE